MPLTRLANAIIDGVAAAPQPVAAEIEKYLARICCSTARPGRRSLIARQAQYWDPVLAWARDALGARFRADCGRHARRAAGSGDCRRGRRDPGASERREDSGGSARSMSSPR